MKGLPQGFVLCPKFMIYISDLGLKVTTDFLSIS